MWKDWKVIQPYLRHFASQINYELLFTLSSLLATIFIILQVRRCVQAFEAPGTEDERFIAKPMLFPSRTAHTRFFPKKNSFSYPYLVVGVPVGWKGTIGGMLSVDLPRGKRTLLKRLFSFKPWSSWYTVDADDHLARGHAEGGLEEKLHDYLLSQDERPKDYPYTYLITPPRLFGYYSNPVSIWNLYSPEKQLKAMILEVNNTFNERHNYFLKVDPKVSTSSPSEPPRFIQQWPKEFHVSPFNSREGSYSISAADPLYPNLSGPGNLNTTITLSSSQSHPKLVARVFSVSPAIDPSTMSVSDKLTFLAKWWWVSFMTFPRTVQQAINLLWKKKMPFITRPEPRTDTTSREANFTEITIERHFLRFLQNVVERCETPFILHYRPAGLPSLEPSTILSPSAALLPRDECEFLSVKILTPLFYSRFVSYPKALDGLLSEHHEGTTISLSRPLSLDSLDFSVFTLPTPQSEDIVSVFDHLPLTFLRKLRSRPDPIENEETIKRKLSKGKPLYIPLHHDNHSKQSDIDHFVLLHGPSAERFLYILSVVQLFMANIFGFGSIEVLELEIFVVRCSLVCFVAWWCLG